MHRRHRIMLGWTLFTGCFGALLQPPDRHAAADGRASSEDGAWLAQERVRSRALNPVRKRAVPRGSTVVQPPAAEPEPVTPASPPMTPVVAPSPGTSSGRTELARLHQGTPEHWPKV